MISCDVRMIIILEVCEPEAVVTMIYESWAVVCTSQRYNQVELKLIQIPGIQIDNSIPLRRAVYLVYCSLHVWCMVHMQ